MEPTKIGERVRQARTDRGEAQGALAERVGIRQSELCDLEAGRRNPSAARVAALARALNVTSDWLLGLPGAPRTRRATKRARKP